jgi:hypothetical protein
MTGSNRRHPPCKGFDLKNKALNTASFFRFATGLPALPPFGPVSATSVYGRTIIGVYVGAELMNGYITKI